MKSRRARGAPRYAADPGPLDPLEGRGSHPLTQREEHQRAARVDVVAEELLEIGAQRAGHRAEPGSQVIRAGVHRPHGLVEVAPALRLAVEVLVPGGVTLAQPYVAPVAGRDAVPEPLVGQLVEKGGLALVRGRGEEGKGEQRERLRLEREGELEVGGQHPVERERIAPHHAPRARRSAPWFARVPGRPGPPWPAGAHGGSAARAGPSPGSRSGPPRPPAPARWPWGDARRIATPCDRRGTGGPPASRWPPR